MLARGDEFPMNSWPTSENPQKAKFAEIVKGEVQLPRIPIPRTRMNKNAKGYYEPLHSTLCSTFCASGANSPNSLARLTKPIVTVLPSMSSKTMALALSPSTSNIGAPVLNLKRSTQFGLPTNDEHVPL